MATFTEPPGDEHARLAALLNFRRGLGTERFTDMFMLELPPLASVYLGPEGWIGGGARQRIAGFWRAVGRPPPDEPDHLAALLGLYAQLADEESEAGGEAEAGMARQARRALVHEHLTPWVFGYLDEAGRTRRFGAYRDWAITLKGVLERAVTELGPADSLSAHLREAPPLPDPRQAPHRMEDLLRAVLAPVRSGVIITATRIAGASSELGLGLRAGERLYALRNLVAQDTPGTLGWLSRSLRAAAKAHDRRGQLLGRCAAHLAQRARCGASLLKELGDEASILAP